MTQNKQTTLTPLQQAAVDSFQAGAAMKAITARISHLVGFCMAQQEANGEAIGNTHLGLLIAAKRIHEDEDDYQGEQAAVDGCKHCSSIVKLLDERKAMSRKRAGARVRLNNIAKQLLDGQQAEGESNV